MTALNVTSADFEKEVLQSDKPVLIDFWAPWCGPCKALTPTIDAFADESAATVKVVKVNVDESKDIAEKYGIRSIPALLVFRAGKPVAMSVGGRSKEDLRKWVGETLQNPAEEAIDPVALSAAQEAESQASAKAAKPFLKKLAHGFGIIGFGLHAVTVGGGVALAAVSTAALPVALGVGAVAIGGFGIYASVRVWQKTSAFIDGIDGPDKKDEPVKKTTLTQAFLKSAAFTVMNTVKLAAGIALFGAGAGPLAIAAAVVMTATGGIATVVSGFKTLGVGIVYGLTKLLPKKASKGAETPLTVAAPANDGPALQTKSLAADFGKAIENKAAEPPQQQAAPAQKPDTAGPKV